MNLKDMADYRQALMTMGAEQMEKDRKRIAELEAELAQKTKALDFYREAYDHHFKRAEALDKSRDELFRREAQHTVAYGMACQERDSWRAKYEALAGGIYERSSQSLSGNPADRTSEGTSQ